MVKKSSLLKIFFFFLHLVPNFSNSEVSPSTDFCLCIYTLMGEFRVSWKISTGQNGHNAGNICVLNSKKVLVNLIGKTMDEP